jgi:DNA replicative helicase MCM subunit Mcm2 (Cdc46/Mcm family)
VWTRTRTHGLTSRLPLLPRPPPPPLTRARRLEFIRKYIAYAKMAAERTKGPTLTDRARQKIVDTYNSA